MSRNSICYYSIQLASRSGAPAKLFHQPTGRELFVSPSTQLSGSMEMACIDSIELAEEFKEACEKIFRKRYGRIVELTLYQTIGFDSGRSLERTRKRISRDSLKVREKLESLVSKKLHGTKSSV